MIREARGNIFEADVDALVNPVNTAGVMGAGLALEFKRRYPRMFEDYRNLCEMGSLDVGRVHIHHRGHCHPRHSFIINLPTKRHWSEKSKVATIQAGLEALVAALKHQNPFTIEMVDEWIGRQQINSIAIPALGCGLGGLAWNDVRPLIVNAMERLPAIESFIHGPN